MIRRDELIIRGCEFLSGLVEQGAKGDLSLLPLSLGRAFALYSSLWTILALHLLVIHAYTFEHTSYQPLLLTFCELR